MRRIPIAALAAMSVLTVSAQLKVQSSGKVAVACTPTLLDSKLSVGYGGYYFTGYQFGTFSEISTGGSNFNIGIKGGSTPSISGRSIGVQGIASNGNTGWNYGVVGGIGSNVNGAGIFGTLTNHVGVQVNGKYAGYFDGNTYVNGTLTATSLVTPSDLRLQDNVQSLNELDNEECVLRDIMKMNVIKYTNKAPELPSSVRDTATTLPAISAIDTHLVHYGVMAKELQESYPELVIEGQDGMLNVNYLELVPILIRSIQELKRQVDELKEGKNDLQHTRGATVDVNEKNLNVGVEKSPHLYPNSPNPFSERTQIRFTLPDNISKAQICIFDMAGKLQKQIPVDASMQSISIDGYELSAGLYLYSLIVEGQEVETRRMILSK